MRRFIKIMLAIAVSAIWFATAMTVHATTVRSYHYDLGATGVNSTELALTPANVNTTSFLKHFSTAVDGQIYAQPLYVPSVTVTTGPQAGVHNLAIVATQHDSLYAIDADSGVIVWHTSFTLTGLPGATSITSVPSADTGSTDTSPEIGVCGTPVIDPATNLLYVDAKTKQVINGVTASPQYVHTLYKIDITNGNATANANIVSSVVVADTTDTNSNFSYRTNNDPTQPQDPFVVGTGGGAITVNGQSRVYFNALRQMQRPALLLYNGTTIYVAYGSHGDNGNYHGWLLGFDKNTLAMTAVMNLTPNGGLGGIWGGGAVPSVDENGYIYVMTGNGSFDGFNNGGVAAGLNSLGFPVNGDYGDSFVKISVDTTTSSGNQNQNGWGLRVVDYFSPFNNQALDAADTDLGSGGCTILPDSAGSVGHPHLMVGSGKQGNIYLVDRDNMGKFNATTDNVVQSQVAIGSCFSTPAFFNGVLYYAGEPDYGKAFKISNAAMSSSPVKTPDQFSWPGCTPTISANGTTNGIVWMMDRTSAQLRAYSAANFGTELWTSAQNTTGSDSLGAVSKFATPTVADGHVLVGTQTALVEYGLTVSASSPPAAPSALTATAVSALQINLSWTDNSNNETGFAVEQSTDDVNFTQIATVGVNVTGYPVISGLQPGTTYYFRVRAFNNYQSLSYSAYTTPYASATTLSTQSSSLNFPSGFIGSNTLLNYNGFAAIVNSRAELTNSQSNEAASIWSIAPQNIQRFSTQFTFQITNSNADGFTFTIQNKSNTVIGGSGLALGYSGITNSICIKFDLYSNYGEGWDSTGLFVNGVNPTATGSKDMTNTGINLHSGDIFLVSLTYDGTNLTETITDTVTSASDTFVYPINIPSTVGSNTAYVGFTGGTGGLTSTQDILTWTYAPLPTTAPSAPNTLVASPASGTQINLSWIDTANNESGYVVQRSSNPAGPFATIGDVGPGQTTYMDTGLTPNTTYYYQVFATNSAGNSAPTNTANATTPIPPPTPTNAQAVAITSTTISMTWTNNATNATGYNIMRKLTAGSNFSLVASLPATATSYTDTNLTPGTSYDYHIQAYNLAGYSDFSGFTAVTLGSSTLPMVTVTAPGGIAVSGVATGQITLTSNSAATAAMPIAYTIGGTGVAGTDYVALSGTATIPTGATSVSIPVTALPGATSGATVTVSIASTSSYTVGSPTSATVVIGSPTYNPTSGNSFASVNVAGTAGSSVSMSFQGLPGSPSGVVYVWYLGGNAFTTTTTGSYTITNAITSQSGVYSVYAYAPGGVTGSQSFVVSITNPPITIVPSVPSLSVNDGSSNSFTVSLASAPISNVTINVSYGGTPDMTVTPSTITMMPTNYTNQPVVVAAAAINSNDGNRTGNVLLSAAGSSLSIVVNDVVSDTQTAANLTGTTYPLTGSNIGSDAAGDSSVHTSGNWWIDGSGVDGLSTTADSFHFESQPVSGNFQMVVQLQNLVATGATTPLAGLMIRDGTAVGSNFLAIAGTAATSGSYQLISRTTVNSVPTQSATTPTYTYPAAWLKLINTASVLHAFVSPDGVNYTEVTNPSTGVTWSGMSSSLNIGVFAASASSANARAVMSNFSISTTGAVPLALVDADIGGPAIASTSTLVNGVYTINAAGFDIWNPGDQFNFDSQSITGDSTIVAYVNSMTNTDPWAKAGVMFRSSSAAGSPMVGVYQNPNGQVELQWRDTLNTASSGIANPVGPTGSPKWLELVKSGAVYTAYYATTTGTPSASNWVLIGSHTAPTNPTTYLAGLATCSHNPSLVCTAVYSNVSINQAGFVPVSGYVDADIGTPRLCRLRAAHRDDVDRERKRVRYLEQQR